MTALDLLTLITTSLIKCSAKYVVLKSMWHCKLVDTYVLTNKHLIKYFSIKLK